MTTRYARTPLAHAEAFHTDRDCGKLAKVPDDDVIVPTDRQVEYHNLGECTECAGVDTRTGGTVSLPHPDEVFGE